MAKESNFGMSTCEAAAPHEKHLRFVWGDDEYVELLSVVQRLCISWKGICLQAMNREMPQRPYIIFGERTKSSQQDMATRCAMNSILPKRSDVRIFFSGAIKGREYLGEYCAPSLARSFKELSSAEQWMQWKDCIEVDNMSRNTGHQVSRLVHDAQVHGVRLFFLCISIEHIVRFAAVLARALQDAGIDNASIVPLCYGEWQDKMPSGLTSAEEAFVSPGEFDYEGDDHVREARPQRAGQYAERWQQSYEKVSSGDWEFGGMLPSQLNDFLDRQPWQF